MTNSLAAVQSALLTCGASPLDIVCIGDRITEGMTAAHRESAWPQRLRDLLRSARFSGSVAGGIGYCPSFSVSSSVGDFWARTGAVAIDGLGTGLGARCLRAPNGASVSLGFTGSGLDVLMTTGTNSAYRYQVDDGEAITVDARCTGINSGVVLPIRGLCDSAHTITISGCSLGSAYLEGAAVYRGDENSGIRIWESGHSGWRASDFNDSDRWHGSFSAVPSPKLVTVLLGTNEYNQGNTSAEYGRALDQLLATITWLLAGKDCSLMVITAHARLPISGMAPWSVYEAVAASTAANRGAGYVRMSDAIGPTQAAIDAGLLQTGAGIHPTQTGHALYAAALSDLLLDRSRA